MSLRFMPSPSLSLDDANEMRNFCDHPTHGGGVFERGTPADLVKAKPDQRGTLTRRPADRAFDLLHSDANFRGRHYLSPSGFRRRFGITTLAPRLQGGNLQTAPRR